MDIFIHNTSSLLVPAKNTPFDHNDVLYVCLLAYDENNQLPVLIRRAVTRQIRTVIFRNVHIP